MTKPRILIVEDDDSILDAVAMAIEDDYHVLCARNGVEALALLDREAVDALVLDLMMPLLDGEAFLHRYRARGGAAPVVLVSAAVELAGRARAMGVDEWLAKPFELEALLDALARVTAGGPAAPPQRRGGPPPAAGDGGPAQESRRARRGAVTALQV